MIISQTPLRVSFFGGGTDYPEYFEKHGGAVLGTAIDKSLVFCMSHFYSRLFDYSIRIAYRKVECVSSIDGIEHAPFRETLRWAGMESDAEVTITAELPACTGLGSSSSFVVGLLNTVYSFQGRLVRGLELAHQAIEIERDILKECVGCQDQTFAAVGGFNLIEFRRMGDFVVHRITLPQQRLQDFEDNLLLVFTGIKRRAANVAKKQVQRVDVNHKYLTQMRVMVDQGYDILFQQGSLAPFGELLDKSWRLKRRLAGCVSNDEIDQTYQAGLEAGALGGKVLGAGGGGFILFFVPPDRREAVRQRLSHLAEIDIQGNASGSRIVHCDPAPLTTPMSPSRKAA